MNLKKRVEKLEKLLIKREPVLYTVSYREKAEKIPKIIPKNSIYFILPSDIREE